MSFNNLKNEKVETTVQKLTVEQKNKICDLFAEGKSAMEIKHLMIKDFTPGKSFHHLIKWAIGKMKLVERDCAKLMSGTFEKSDGKFYSKPKTLNSLKANMKIIHESCDEDSLEHLVDKVVATTGTFTDYKKAFVVEV